MSDKRWTRPGPRPAHRAPLCKLQRMCHLPPGEWRFLQVDRMRAQTQRMELSTRVFVPFGNLARSDHKVRFHLLPQRVLMRELVVCCFFFFKICKIIILSSKKHILVQTYVHVPMKNTERSYFTFFIIFQ